MTPVLPGRWLGVLAFALTGCHSEPLDTETCSDVFVYRETLTRRCGAKRLHPVTDPERPDYGQVDCVMVSAWPAGSGACRCDTAGFAPATPEQLELGRSTFGSTGWCEGPCCEEYCFCEFLQHSGDALAACQSRPSEGTYSGEPSGWCYVEPELGLGSEDDIAECPPRQGRRFRLFPEKPRYNILLALACATGYEPARSVRAD